VGGIEELKSNFSGSRPELIIDIDRQRANREGISTWQTETSTYCHIRCRSLKIQEAEEQYPIQLRLDEFYRESIDRLMNLKIMFMGSSGPKSIPLYLSLQLNSRIIWRNQPEGSEKGDHGISNLLSGYTSNK